MFGTAFWLSPITVREVWVIRAIRGARGVPCRRREETKHTRTRGPRKKMRKKTPRFLFVFSSFSPCARELSHLLEALLEGLDLRLLALLESGVLLARGEAGVRGDVTGESLLGGNHGGGDGDGGGGGEGGNLGGGVLESAGGDRLGRLKAVAEGGRGGGESI